MISDQWRALASMTMEQRKAVIAEVCPYCRASLPEMYEGGARHGGLGAMHYIPHADQRFRCAADSLRASIQYAIAAVEKEAPTPSGEQGGGR